MGDRGGKLLSDADCSENSYDPSWNGNGGDMPVGKWLQLT